MKLSKLYSNKPSKFEAVNFVDGLNVVLAEIRLPENKAKDTHNLGKTTLGRLLDFCFLASKKPGFFLFKHQDRFGDFVFYLELLLPDLTYITVRRSVANATKIAFKRHDTRWQDFSHTPDSQWDHVDVAFERAKEMLDGNLDWEGLKPWGYRKGLGYQLREQADYSDVFKLKRFQAAHSDWKPFVAHILGFNHEPIVRHYEIEKNLENQQTIETTVKRELGGSIEDLSKIQGIRFRRQEEVERKQRLLDAFDFREEDQKKTTALVEDIDSSIASLNQERYSLTHTKKKISRSLEDSEILFDPQEAKLIFDQAGVVFDGQLKRDFEQLIAFNRAITQERRQYLREELSEVEGRIKELTRQLDELGVARSDALEFLSDSDVFTKYKRLSRELATLLADIDSLERQIDLLGRLQELRSEIRGLEEDLVNVRSAVETDHESKVSDKQSLFSRTNSLFNSIIEKVISRGALLEVRLNKLGHLDFAAGILDDANTATSADAGHTYRKLLCIAFDLATLRAHLTVKFPRFVFHDGVFESLDNRKKSNLLDVLRDYSNAGIQSIITLIDSDLPPADSPDRIEFSEEEIVMRLHDEGDDGRLFKMPPW